MRTLDPTRTPEYRAVMTVVSTGCGLATIGSVIPAVEHAVNVGTLGLGILAALVVMARLLVRFIRERIEDRADTRTADAWRATHSAADITARHARVPLGVS